MTKKGRRKVKKTSMHSTQNFCETPLDILDRNKLKYNWELYLWHLKNNIFIGNDMWQLRSSMMDFSVIFFFLWNLVTRVAISNLPRSEVVVAICGKACDFLSKNFAISMLCLAKMGLSCRELISHDRTKRKKLKNMASHNRGQANEWIDLIF